jgi:hypothetical protein
MKVEGPLRERVGRLPELLLVAHFLWRRPDGDVSRFYRSTKPEVVGAAQKLPRPDSGAGLKDALSTLVAS